MIDFPLAIEVDNSGNVFVAGAGSGPANTDFVTIKYNAAQVTPDQVVELLKLAGFHIGIGGWRPQCDGQYGMFHVKI